MDFVKARVVSLKVEPGYNEKWLQQKLVNDPTLLGLGDLVVKDVERRQPKAGRLDLLLSDPESNTRYEVEIQLGATDESHIIRTIEYWDIEKSRYPQYDHVAVIVAEDITSRFLNVLSLMNRAVPLIAIQIRALEVAGALTLAATTVLDLYTPGTEEEDESGTQVDRQFWINRGSASSVQVADEVLKLVEPYVPGLSLKYNKNYIGLASDGVPNNFVIFRARREHAIVEFRIPRSDEINGMLESSSLYLLEYSRRWGRYRFRMSLDELRENRDLIKELIRRSSATEADDD